MTRSTTWRIPGRLRNKLQASLSKLSAKEAGRLWLIHAHEAEQKKQPINDYPPVKELWAALQAKVDKSRGKPEEAQAVADFNGLVFLQYLVIEANEFAFSATVSLDGDVYRAASRIDRLLLLDAVGDVARSVKGRLYDSIPKPVSREDYDRILKWAKTGALMGLAEVAENLRLEWIEEQNFSSVDIPLEYIRVKAEEMGQDWRELEFTQGEEAKALRRQYAEDLGLLETVFNGDEDRLEEWIEYPVFDHYAEISRAELQAKTDEFNEKLEALLASGELEGGEGVYIDGGEILIRDGKIPALFALRDVWGAWVEGQGFKIREYWPDPIGPNGIGKVYDPNDDDDLDRAALEDLVAGFLKDVKGRPWGKGLADLRKSHMKPAALVDLLIRESDPLLQMEVDKPDWGMVDFETFADNERSRFGRSYESRPVATVASLNKVAGKVADLKTPFDFGFTWYEEQYYPTKDFERQRDNFAFIFSMLNTIEITEGGFSFRNNDPTVASIMGVNFATPLEQTVEALRLLYVAYVSLDQAFKKVSDLYFDGLPFIWADTSTRFAAIEDRFAEAIDDLDRWLAKLERWPWKVDVSSLRVERPEPDEDQVADLVDIMVEAGRYRSRISDAELKKTGLFFND